MKKILTAAALLLCVTCINAQVTQEWVQTYTGGDLSTRNSVLALDNAGNVYAAGYYNDGTVNSMLLLKYDATGTILWSRTYLPAGYTSASGYAVAIDGNGDVIVTGRASPFTGNAGFTRKYDTDGNLLWSQSAIFSALRIATDEYNNIYLSSWQEGNSQTIKYNPSGIQQWIATYNGSFTYSKIVYKNGAVYITAYGWAHPPGTPPATSIPALITIKYNASNGTQAWAASYIHSDKIAQGGECLTVDGTGNIYVAGYVYNKAGSNQNVNWITLKYNSAGTQQWVKIYDGNGNDYYNPKTGASNGLDGPTDIALDNNGDIIVTGTSYTTTGQYTSEDITTIKYNSAGSQLWIKTYDGPAHTKDKAWGIATDASSNIYLTGYTDKNITNSSYSGNSTTIKYNTSGTLLDVANYDGGANVGDVTGCIRINNTGNIFVGGSSIATTSRSSLLIKYSQAIPLMANKQVNASAEDSRNVIKIYPNPVTDQLRIETPDNKLIGTIIISNASGETVYRQMIGNSQTVIDVRRFSPGVYYLRSDQSATAIKFVKQ